jgi:hypothetical protein
VRPLRGSWPALFALAVLFLAAFYGLRSCSNFLRIERDQAVAEQLAADMSLAVADVMALHDMLGPDTGLARWRAVAEEFGGHLYAAVPSQLGADLGRSEAGLAAFEAVKRAIAAIAPSDLAVRRFLLMRERFAARH